MPAVTKIGQKRLRNEAGQKLKLRSVRFCASASVSSTRQKAPHGHANWPPVRCRLGGTQAAHAWIARKTANFGAHSIAGPHSIACAGKTAQILSVKKPARGRLAY